MNYQTNLTIKPEYWDYEESHKNNVVAFRRQESHGIVETHEGEKSMSRL